MSEKSPGYQDVGGVAGMPGYRRCRLYATSLYATRMSPGCRSSRVNGVGFLDFYYA